MEDLKNNYEAIQIIVATISVAIVILGWFYNSARARALQRKQLAIKLLHENRFEKIWVDGLFVVGRFIGQNPTYDWEGFAVRVRQKLDINVPEEEKAKMDFDLDLHVKLRCVLNNLEAIAIAIKYKAINEDIVYHSYSQFYTDLGTRLDKYIVKSREITSSNELYINFTEIRDKWKEKPVSAKAPKWWQFWK